MGLLSPINLNYITLHRHTEFYLLRESRSCQFDDQYLPLQGLILSRSEERHWFGLPTSEGFFFFLILRGLVFWCWLLTPMSCSCCNSCSSKCLAIFISFPAPVPHHLECCKHPLFQFTRFQLRKDLTYSRCYHRFRITFQIADTILLTVKPILAFLAWKLLSSFPS